MVGARDDEHGTVLGAGEGRNQQLEPDRKRKGLVGVRPPKGTSSSGRARPAITSPCVTAPIETSMTTGRPSDEGMPIASGLVPVNGGATVGMRRAGVARSRSARDETPSASRLTQQPRHPVGKQPSAITIVACRVERRGRRRTRRPASGTRELLGRATARARGAAADPLGPRARVERLLLEPGDPRVPVSLPFPARSASSKCSKTVAASAVREAAGLEPSERLLPGHAARAYPDGDPNNLFTTTTPPPNTPMRGSQSTQEERKTDMRKALISVGLLAVALAVTGLRRCKAQEHRRPARDGNVLDDDGQRTLLDLRRER